MRPVAKTRSDLEVIEASIREKVDGRDMIRNQPFVRIRATLSTAATSLSEDVPAYDPVAILSATQPIEATAEAPEVNTDIYGAEVEGEVAVRLAAMPMTFVPPRAITDQSAAEFVRMSVDAGYSDIDSPTLAYASLAPSVRDLGFAPDGNVIGGVAENVTVVPKTTLPSEASLGRTERILTIRETSPLDDVLKKNGFTEAMIARDREHAAERLSVHRAAAQDAAAHSVRPVAHLQQPRALSHEHLSARRRGRHRHASGHGGA